MAGRIPQQFIQDLLSRVDIVDVVSERIHLKKTGQNYAACCPFHNEKTPSFTVSPDKQFYHCFGCGAHGSAIGFLMEYERLDFLDAVQQLALRVGLEIPRGAESGKPADDHQPLYALLDAAAKYYEVQLREPAAAPAVAYLKGRGLTGAIAKEYGIGCALPGWDNLLQQLGRDDASRKLLARAGLVIEKDAGGYYDRFRNRVMFPIRDARGRVIGFGGRVLDDNDTPKYLNSPETPVFHKGRELYGLHEARKRARELKQLIVVEGYMDVVGLAQFGIGNAVATLGTATTAEHVERLFRMTGEVVFCFDGDNAGRKAAWRALEAALPRMTGQHQARFMFLPEGEDPDSLVRKEGRDKFLERTVTAIPLSTFLLEHLTAQADLSSIDGRARLVELARPHLSKVPSEVFRQMLLSRLAELVHMDAAQLSRAIGGEVAAPSRPPAIARRPAGHVAPSAVRIAVKLLLMEPALAQRQLDVNRIPGNDPRAALLLRMIELLREQPHMKQGMLLEYFRGTPEGEYLGKVAQWSWAAPAEGIAIEFDGAIERLMAQRADARTQELLEKARATGLTHEEKAELKQLVAAKSPAPKAERNGVHGSH